MSVRIIYCLNIKMNEKCEMNYSDILGRFIVAKHDIKEGDVILRDVPVAVGPRANSNLLCVACFRPFTNRFGVCPECKIAPICSDKCATHKRWHSTEECAAFCKLKQVLSPIKLVQNMNSVTTLRCILLSHTNNDHSAWDELMKMEAHMDKRRGSAIWNFHKETVEFIKLLEILPKNSDPEELIQKVCSVIDVNSFELRSLSSDRPPQLLQGIYPKAALMAHDCMANTHIAIDNDFNMTVRASLSINKGETIYFNYTNALQGTINRRIHLKEGKYFDCICKRCADPTELGLHVSSLLCTSCEGGLVYNKKPLQASQVWACETCAKCYSDSHINEMLKRLSDRFELIDKENITNLEIFIKDAAKIVYKNHYLLVEAKQHLAGLLRDTINRETNPHKKILVRKIELCKEMLPMLDKVEPGISRLKAITLYEIHISIVQLANKKFEFKEITTADFLNELTAAEKMLHQSILYLLLEPAQTPEGTLCRRAVEELRMLRQYQLQINITNMFPDNINH